MQLFTESEFSDLPLSWRERRAVAFVESHARWRISSLVVAVLWTTFYYLVFSPENRENATILLIVVWLNVITGQFCTILVGLFRRYFPVAPIHKKDVSNH